MNKQTGFIKFFYTKYFFLLRELVNLINFTKETQKSPLPISFPKDDLKSWREGLLINEKERDRLTKLALKQQDELKKNFINSKLATTKLTVF